MAGSSAERQGLHSPTGSRDRAQSLSRGLASRLLSCLCLCLAVTSPAAADDHVFRIGTGGTAGTYFPIGELIAQAMNQSRGTDAMDQAQGATPLVLAQRSNGSVSNVQEIGEGLLESGLTQADVAHWAYEGTGPFDTADRLPGLRAIATLYLESVHLVVSTASNIQSIADLVGRSVSVDEVGSGTLLDVELILKAYGIGTDDAKIVYLKPIDAIDRMRNGQLDAFFIVAGYPIAGVSELIGDGVGKIVPISGAVADSLREIYPFFTADSIPEQTYANDERIPTLAVAAQWVVHARLDDALVHRLTRSLWSGDTQRILTNGHPKGHEVTISSALVGSGIPLHPGARRYYVESGMSIPDSFR